jgi:hypothetical protein
MHLLGSIITIITFLLQHSGQLRPIPRAGGHFRPCPRVSWFHATLAGRTRFYSFFYGRQIWQAIEIPFINYLFFLHMLVNLAGRSRHFLGVWQNWIGSDSERELVYGSFHFNGTVQRCHWTFSEWALSKPLTLYLKGFRTWLRIRGDTRFFIDCTLLFIVRVEIPCIVATVQRLTASVKNMGCLRLNFFYFHCHWQRQGRF